MRRIPRLVTVALLYGWICLLQSAGPHAFGQTLRDNENLALAQFFVDQRLRERGPSRSPFEMTAARELVSRILAEPTLQTTLGLSVESIAELREKFSQLSKSHIISKLGGNAIEAIDELDADFEHLLMATCNGDCRQQIAFELLCLEGLSALRRPIVASQIGLSAEESRRLCNEIDIFWERGFSLQRAVFERGMNTDLAKGLELLSTGADLAALCILSTDQRSRLNELVARKRTQALKERGNAPQ